MSAQTDKNTKAASVHAGHRDRVREKYVSNGLNSFADHEVLELLLFYANKRGDTNPIAHKLIERFGSLSTVLEASYDDLICVDGIGDTAATLITLVPQLFRRYTCDKAEKNRFITNPDEAKAFVAPHFFGLSNEKIGIVCLDSQNRVNNFTFVSEGSLKLAQIDIRKVAQIALRNNAASIIIAHNHPGGIATPSRNDVETTKTLVNALSLINITVADHIIVSDDDSFSMATHSKFAPFFMMTSCESAPRTGLGMSQDDNSH